jgi:hypothetical protein
VFYICTLFNPLSRIIKESFQRFNNFYFNLVLRFFSGFQKFFYEIINEFSFLFEENPRPDNGPITSIKLYEAEEILTSMGQQHKVLSEFYFQMNYETGEYKKFKQYKQINN